MLDIEPDKQSQVQHGRQLYEDSVYSEVTESKGLPGLTFLEHISRKSLAVFVIFFLINDLFPVFIDPGLGRTLP